MGRHRLPIGKERDAEGQADGKAYTGPPPERYAVRAVVQRIFARQKGSMRLLIRTLGIAVALAKIELTNPA